MQFIDNIIYYISTKLIKVPLLYYLLYRPLGPLIYIRLWHDNSGVGDKASWYCNYVGVVDLQTREKSHFIVESWFAVEEGDGQVNC